MDTNAAGYVTDVSNPYAADWMQTTPTALQDVQPAAAPNAQAPASSGTPWLQVGLGGLGAGLMTVPALMANNRDYSQYGDFQLSNELQSQLDEIDKLIAQLRSPDATKQAAGPLMPGVTHLARNNAAAAGIEGPLAASMASQAQTNLVSALEQQRLQNLMAVLQQRAGLADLATGARERYAQALANWKQMMAQRGVEEAVLAGKIGGGVVGAIGSMYTGGAINPAMGASLGGSLAGWLAQD
jgi:hypothetical protein